MSVDSDEGTGHHDIGYGSPSWLAINEYRKDMAIAVAVYDALAKQELELVEYPLETSGNGTEYPYYKSHARAVKNGNRVIGAGVFLRVLERLRLTRAFDRYVVQSAIKRLRERTEIKLGCEVSVLSAVDDVWWASLKDTLRRNPSIAARLVIEIREPSVLAKRSQMIGFIMAIQRAGCGVSFSGFGTRPIHHG
ncbi:EAL domain-containing protein [Agrobacterium tumefaciens]|uniref:EAL domain-containing protein n=1 Tax=Agrobacterium tumefaciens TaxID=358 RepID=UPI0021D1CC10|nr:EAL domain-containing protein [Agrobacterium tumefaciens]UXS05401.1 EAL domain-containing protein [Agrobacterium tumefaciens]